MSNTQQYCTLMVDRCCFGVPVDDVQEVLRSQPVTGVPLASADIAGLINLRGQIVTAIDLRARLGSNRRSGDDPMNVIVRTGESIVSFLVDGIGDVVTVSGDQFEGTPQTLDQSMRELVTGVYKLPDRLLLVLDVTRASDTQQCESKAH